MPRTSAALLLGVLVFAGCAGRPPEPVPVPVRGKVIDAQKKPVAGVIIRFWPQPNYSGSRDGATQTDGSFEVSCPPGKYEVTLMHIPSQHGGDPGAGGTAKAGKSASGKTAIPPRLLDVKKTPWRDIDVPAEGRSGLELAVVE